jgi:hypothetical protein
MFVGNTPILAVQNELVYFESIPTLAHIEGSLAAELPLYKELSTAAINALLVDVNGVAIEPTPDELWMFWPANCLRLPSWYIAARRGALFMMSSACVERIFSLYDSMFSDSQESALEDRREGSVIIYFRNSIAGSINESILTSVF